MTITESSWVNYIDSLSKINKTAADLMRKFLNTHKDVEGLWNAPETRQAIINYAYGLSTKYGEAAAELACEMYDEMGVLSEVTLPLAVPADTATYSEAAKTVNGVLKTSQNEETLAGAVERLVKLAAVDTIMQNALRDGAEWAWIPHGDTCAFCITLASRGWQQASKKAIKNGHAEHIHANCDCTYAVRFDSRTNVQGYDPDKYKRMYYDAPLDGQRATGKNRINAMRREFYAENKEEINDQKRSAYEKRKERESSSAEEMNVNT